MKIAEQLTSQFLDLTTIMPVVRKGIGSKIKMGQAKGHIETLAYER